jgi:hypothetical protein
VLGIKSHPLDDGEVPLFMSFCSWHRGGTKAVVSFGLKLEKNVICNSKIKRENQGNQQDVTEKRKEISRDSCAEKRKELQTGRHYSHNANGQCYVNYIFMKGLWFVSKQRVVWRRLI